MQRRTLIAHPSHATRRWLAAGLGTSGPDLCEVEVGWELLWQLSETPFGIVVADARLPGLSGVQALAMVRTAGLRVPFLILEPFPSRSMRAMVKRVGAAAIVDDWTDGEVLRAAKRRLIDAHTPHADEDDLRAAMRQLLLGPA